MVAWQFLPVWLKDFDYGYYEEKTIMGQSEFDRLEQFVKRLLEKYDVLKKENESLKVQLGERDEEVVLLESELDSIESERGNINDRVKALIRQIENWENQLDSAAPVSEPSKKTEPPEAQTDHQEDNDACNIEMSKSSEAGDSQPPESVKEAQEGVTQQNLFHVNKETSRFRME